MTERLGAAGLPVGMTGRGFECVEFLDANGRGCSVQASSGIGQYPDAAPGTSLLWLCRAGGPGSRMHLDREQVAGLVKHLEAWLATGSLVVKP